MKTVSAHTLGCKVNQYDTQAMLELLFSAGWSSALPEEDADVYLVNTCTVTGVGDKKSMQMIRRLRRNHPSAILVVCGCMAQLFGEELLSSGADLILGTRRRSDIVSLLQTVISEKRKICAVEPLRPDEPYEHLSVTAQNEHTRAVLKIQEGCNNRCTYCIIPAVRGPIRSRPLSDIHAEAESLCAKGCREIVLTGIHLSSYGRDFQSPASLLDAVCEVGSVAGILRIRLGSLEPTIATEAFVSRLSVIGSVCPHFHLALQSGSDSVLARMKRRYNTAQYLKAADNLRAAFPRAALTTDVMTGFPGETADEFDQTCRFLKKVGFARIHVFPYSPRPRTPAALMPNQLTKAVKEERARQLIALGAEMSAAYRASWLGQEAEVLPEEWIGGCLEGYTPEYIRVRIPSGPCQPPFEPVRVRLSALTASGMTGE